MGESEFTIGVDVGGSNLRVALVGHDGTLGERRSERISRDADAAVARIRDLCRELRRDWGSTSVTGVGIGIPGRVDGRRGRVLSGGYIDFAAARLVERVEDAIGVPVSIDNDCNMALVGEMAVGAARGVANVVMFTIGTGIGGAIAIEGFIIRGAGTAGQLGHISVAEDGALCNCGRRGCIETTSSGSALERLVTDAGLRVGTRVEDLEAAANGGDARAAGVLLNWIVPLRSAIDGMVAAVCPDVVLLGGGLGGAAVVALGRAPAVSPWYQCPVRAALLGDDAGVIGSGLTAARLIALGTASAAWA